MPISLPSSLWAAQVAAATPLPDARLNTRLERLLIDLAAKPLDAFPQAAADWHQSKATYRFLANSRFAWEDLLVGWHVTTAQHLAGHDLVYIAHDTLFRPEADHGFGLPQQAGSGAWHPLP